LHVIYATCACGHTGVIKDPAAIEAHKSMRPIRAHCSKCGAANRFRTVLSYDAGGNPMDAARPSSTSSGRPVTYDG
jgi:hypothetical protein